jgi:DNA-binding MarR family transcriptional regulator
MMQKTDCIFFQFAKAYQLSSRFLTSKVSELNLTSVQAMVLGFLTEEDQITSSELGKRTELDSATLTGILDRLEAAGYLQRKSNPDDRRSIHIHLTSKGKALGLKASQLITRANQEFLQVLTDKQKKELREIIQTLRLSKPRLQDANANPGASAGERQR